MEQGWEGRLKRFTDFKLGFRYSRQDLDLMGLVEDFTGNLLFALMTYEWLKTDNWFTLIKRLETYLVSTKVNSSSKSESTPPLATYPNLRMRIMPKDLCALSINNNVVFMFKHISRSCSFFPSFFVSHFLVLIIGN